MTLGTWNAKILTSQSDNSPNKVALMGRQGMPSQDQMLCEVDQAVSLSGAGHLSSGGVGTAPGWLLRSCSQ